LRGKRGRAGTKRERWRRARGFLYCWPERKREEGSRHRRKKGGKKKRSQRVSLRLLPAAREKRAEAGEKEGGEGEGKKKKEKGQLSLRDRMANSFREGKKGNSHGEQRGDKEKNLSSTSLPVLRKIGGKREKKKKRTRHREEAGEMRMPLVRVKKKRR